MDLSKLNIFGKIYNFKDTEARNKGEENAKAIKEVNEKVASVDEKATQNKKSVGIIENTIEAIKNKLSSIRSIVVSSTTPTDDNVELWINPSETESFSIPEVKDDVINVVDTWSSKKISDELTSLGNETTKKIEEKVDKIDGKSLSTNDYTTAEKNKLSSLKNYDDAKVKESIGTIEKNLKSLSDNTVTIDIINDLNNNTPHIKTISQYYDSKRTGKVYQTKVWKFATNPTTSCEKLLDNEGLVFETSTDTTEGKDDYLNGKNPLFEWVYCNYKRYEDGTAYPIATEYDENYAETGSVDVGAMQMSFYWNWDSSNPEYDLVTISDSPNEKYGLKPWFECVKADGTVLPYCIGSAYFSGIASDGLLRSQPNLEPSKNQSYNNIITNYSKKGTGYCGAGIERNTFGILFDIIKGANKSSQNIHYGCYGYSFQYSASIKSDEAHEYFPVTNAQASSLIIGSTVSVGYGSLSNSTLSNDRSYSSVHKYVNNKRITKIETLDDNNKAVYFEGDTVPFTTTPVALNDSVNADIIISSMEWYSGTTKNVVGRHDGSIVSNTSGKIPYRVQGREYAIGAYTIPSNAVMVFKDDYSKDVYIAKKGIKRTSVESEIKSTYKLIGNIPGNNGADFWIGDIGVDVETCGTYPKTTGSNNSQGTGDYCYAGGKSTSGTREFLQGGYLWVGSAGGSSCLPCWGWLGGAGWAYCAAD